ncbi:MULTISPECIES: hypothetical protein [Hymenobacter]|uniref:Uncharacterized protein n=1 Tax=Hymenobacter profundi TaxID=1982110 RepID=A0ABS6X172_9BACT|nr:MULTISPECIES: hypothetical protein [Hymenobacter]MBW3129579.1 hypothetical protein [Hymenobacter profundi]QNE38691.1 hypothetical protein F1C16_03535 [Hymenobacter sp. NBH84]
MQNILFPSCPLTTTDKPAPLSAPPQPTTIRRLLSISMALQLSGAPAPTAATRILLARYVAGHLSLTDILPELW